MHYFLQIKINAWLVPDFGGRFFALVLDKKNMSSYLGPLVQSSPKIVQISSSYVLV